MKYKARVRQKLKDGLIDLYRLFGYDFLKGDKTIDFIDEYAIYKKIINPVKLPKLISYNGIESVHFKEDREISFYPDMVSMISPNQKVKKIRIRNSGAIVIDKNYLNLDFGYSSSLKEFNLKKQVLERPVIAPWSHRWAGYYDYLIFVAAKLCRIEKALDQEIWSESIIYYPYLGTQFESEILGFFNLKEGQLLDLPKKTDLSIYGQLIMGNNQRWFFPSPVDIELIRKKFLPVGKPTAQTRIYVERRGSREVINNSEVKKLLHDFGFTQVLLEDMTIREQIELFREAKMVVAPHGAGLANILWCSPGTHLIELFGDGYFPPYYYYLSHILGLNYHCLVENNSKPDHFKYNNKYNNMTVDVKLLERLIKSVSDKQAVENINYNRLQI